MIQGLVVSATTKPKKPKKPKTKKVKTMQNRPDGSGMVVQRWRRDALNASTEMPATIRTNSGPIRNDERQTVVSKKKIK